VQSIIILFGLSGYYLYSLNNLYIAIFIYFFPPIIINIILVYKISLRKIKKIDFSTKRLPIIFKNAIYFLYLNILSSIFLGSDYYFAAHFLDSGEVTQYHIITRFYFFSYIAYFSYIQYKTIKLNQKTFYENSKLFRETIFNSIAFGIFCVVIVFILFLLFENFGMLYRFSKISELDIVLSISALAYYIFRVIRDVYLVVLINAEMRHIVIMTYTFELVFGVSLLAFSVQNYGFYGILFSMALVSAISSLILFIFCNKITCKK
jgi:hypothetical protein